VRVPEAHKMVQAVTPNVINHLRSVLIYAFVIRSAAKFVEPVTHHSYLNATIGSTLAARRAGKKQAAKAVEASSSATEMSVTESVALVSKSKRAMNRVEKMAATSPIPIPTRTDFIPPLRIRA